MELCEKQLEGVTCFSTVVPHELLTQLDCIGIALAEELSWCWGRNDDGIFHGDFGALSRTFSKSKPKVIRDAVKLTQPESTPTSGTSKGAVIKWLGERLVAQLDADLQRDMYTDLNITLEASSEILAECEERLIEMHLEWYNEEAACEKS